MKREAHAERRLAAPPAEVAAVLADYARYREWLPGVEQSRVLAAEGDVAVVELAAPARPPLVLETVRASATSLLFRQVDRYRRSGLAGRIELAPGAHGGETRVQAAATWAAGWLDFRASRRLRERLEHALTALETRLAAGAAGAVPVRRRKLLEVVRTPHALELRLPGEVVRLPWPAAERRP